MQRMSPQSSSRRELAFPLLKGNLSSGISAFDNLPGKKINIKVCVLHVGQQKVYSIVLKIFLLLKSIP